MATVTKRIEPHRRLGLSSTPSMRIVQATGFTGKKGDPVFIDGSGQIRASETTGTSSGYQVAQVSESGMIVGFLLEDGASGLSDKIGFIPNLPGMMFKGQLVETTTGSLHVLAQTDVGASMGLVKFSGDTHWGVNSTPGSGNECVKVVELIDDIGTTGGMVGFVVNAEWRQLDLG